MKSTHQALSEIRHFSPRGIRNVSGRKPVYKLEPYASYLMGWMNCFEANDYIENFKKKKNKREKL